MQGEQTSRGKDKWGIETYLKGSLILAIATVVGAMVLYVQSVLKETAWGALMVGSVALTVSAYVYAERSKLLRVAVRAVVYLLTAIAVIGAVICTVFSVLQSFDPMPSVAMYATALSPLVLFTLPVLAAQARARKAMDIWTFRIAAVIYAVLLVVGCVFDGGFIEWTFSSVYVKLFVCLLAVLTANFACLIRTKKI